MSNTTEPLVEQMMIDTVIQATILLVIILASVFFNALILFSFYKHKPLQTITNAFVVNLACTDFFYPLLAMPLTLTTSITVNWVFGEFMCKYQGFVIILFCEASIWTLTSVSFERFLFILYPFNHQRWVTPMTVSATLASIWILALAFASIPFWISKYSFDRFSHVCTVDWSVSIQTTSLYMVFSIITPLFLMTIYNIGILKTALKQNRNAGIRMGHIQRTVYPADSRSGISESGSVVGEQASIVRAQKREKKEMRATILVLIIVSSFVICWLPYSVTTMCLTIKGSKCTWSSRLFVATAWLTCLNSAMNPILYIVFNVNLRRAIQQILCSRTTTSD